jgi:hypothetical protein
MSEHYTDTAFSGDPETGKYDRFHGRVESMEVSGSKMDKTKLLEAYNAPPPWKKRCWNWCGLTSEDPKSKKRAQIGCSICCAINITFIVLIFTVRTFVLFCHFLFLFTHVHIVGYYSCGYPRSGECQ